MARINILDKRVYCKISAGEVVENPSSVVKELVENSLDAKCKNIVIEIKNGGLEYIRVRDDGCGIEMDDLPKAFMSHATSKIITDSDLENISTLGFRGEALASIGSVSHVELISKTKDSEVAGKIVVAGGDIEDVTEVSGNTGTCVTVRNLFYNTPVRRKFLKKPKQEENAITNIVTRLMFSSPDISIKYIIDDKTIYNARLDSIKDRIFEIYGKETASHLLEVKSEKDGYIVSGYISEPLFSKANRTYQTLIINGRYVINKLISTAVFNAFENFTMKGKFPLYVLTLTIPRGDIDVNIHPNKLDVKFREDKKVFDIVYHAVFETLTNASCEKNVFFHNEMENLKKTSDTYHDLPKIVGGYSFGQNEDEREVNTARVPQFVEDGRTLTEERDIDSAVSSSPMSTKDVQDLGSNGDDFEFFKFNKKEEYEQQNIGNDLDFKVIGSIFSTYILVEFKDYFYIIDQHAGHERILYDELMKSFKEKKLISQPLLIPYVFDINPEERETIEENMDTFRSLGFTLEEFGPHSYRITAVPTVLIDINLEAFIQDALKNPMKVSSTNEEVKHFFATCACKAAVKAGQKLRIDEIKRLLSKLLEGDRKLLCPHGRPICISFSKNEIEKMFKRIV